MNTTTDTIPAALEAARAYAASLQEVASAEIWVPTAEEIAEYAADGITARPTLDVEVWGSERNPSDVRTALLGRRGLVYVGKGSSMRGPIFSFQVQAA